MLYNLNMSKFMHYLQIFYFVFQSFVAIINCVLFIMLAKVPLYLFILFLEYKRMIWEHIIFWSIIILVALALIGYLIINFLSLRATKNLIKLQPLTKLQKISSVIFPIITVPLYSFFIYKLFF